MFSKKIFKAIIAVVILILAIFVYIRLSTPMEIPSPEEITEAVNLTAEEKAKIEASVSDMMKKIETCQVDGDNSNCYMFYLQLGINYEGLGKITRAIESYNLASKEKPDLATPYSNIGSIYRRLKDFGKAEEYFKKALSITPNNPVVYGKMYELYFYDMKKLPDEMISFFSEALKNTNDDPSVARMYAFYSENINDIQSALDIWKIILSKEPDNTAAKTKIKQLEEKIKAGGI